MSKKTPKTPKDPTAKPRQRRAPGQAGPKGRAKTGRLAPASGDAQFLEDQLGEPLETAFQGVTPQMIDQSTQDLSQLRQQMTLPPPTPQLLEAFLGKPYSGQAALAYVIAKGLTKSQPVPTAGGDGQVSPQVLRDTRVKLDISTRAQSTLARGQNFAADARLCMGARLSFLLGKLIAAYREKLTSDKLSRADKLKLVSDFSRLTALQVKPFDQRDATKAGNQQQADDLDQQLQDQLDEVAFMSAKFLLDKGDTPEPEMLLRAQRHAQRTKATADQAVLDAVAERRGATRH